MHNTHARTQYTQHTRAHTHTFFDTRKRQKNQRKKEKQMRLGQQERDTHDTGHAPITRQRPRPYYTTKGTTKGTAQGTAQGTTQGTTNQRAESHLDGVH